jgi:hypothetical protein
VEILMYALTLTDGFCCAWFIHPISHLALALVFRDKDQLYPLGSPEYVPPEDEYRIQSPKHGVLNEKRMMDNVQNW